MRIETLDNNNVWFAFYLMLKGFVSVFTDASLQNFVSQTLSQGVFGDSLQPFEMENCLLRTDNSAINCRRSTQFGLINGNPRL